MFFKRKQLYEIGCALDRGIKRKNNPNQDALIVLTSRGRRKLPTVLVLADGMGGYTGGEAASQAVRDAFRELYRKTKRIDNFLAFSTQAIQAALEKMKKYAARDANYQSMGSTLVAVCFTPGSLSVVNVGDSRAYLFHQGAVRQVSFDHSFVAEAVRAGLLSAEEAAVHPKKNQLTQSITPRRTEIKPFYAQLPFEKNDVVLLCSDGLWGVVSESMIQSIVIELPVQHAAEKLVKVANSRGGPDNISVIIARHAGAVPPAPSPSTTETLPG
jgi:protein phosphatase